MRSGGANSNVLRCADVMITTLAAWNIERAAAGEPPLASGIGLNYEPAVIGDVSGGQSLSFTVIGDTVNTASPLQRLTAALRHLSSSAVALRSPQQVRMLTLTRRR